MNSKSIGILAYGSLINDPGVELEPLIEKRIECTTPFCIEYARLSKSRNNAPTLIPVAAGGAKVKAVILLLNEKVSLAEAKNILWRRETRQKDVKKVYIGKSNGGENSVQVKELSDFEGVQKVIYTSIPCNIGINKPEILAQLAVDSILSEAGEKQLDGVRYLLNAIRNGIITPLTQEYENGILKLSSANSLEEAITKLDAQRPSHLKKKGEWDEFEKQVIEIADLICEYGIKTTQGDKILTEDTYLDFLKENKESFIKNCHQGYKLGQKKILTLMLKFEKEHEKLKEQLKGINKKTNGTLYQEVQGRTWVNERKQTILRHLIDTIVWQMISGQVHIARQLHRGVEGKKRLLHSNIESVIRAADELNAVENDFALICDLSSYIQVGDILLTRGDKTLTYIEVKEGKKNHEVFAMLNEIIHSDESVPNVMQKLKLDKSTAQQLDRNLKQFSEMLNIYSITNNDKGLDKSGKPLKIITPKEDVPRFMRELSELYSELQTRNLLAYNVIENCLYIGLFKGPLRYLGANILEAISDQEGKKFIRLNYLSIINTNYKPLFMMPFPKNFIFDILFRRVEIHFILDIDKYLDLFPKYRMKAEWLSRKETMKIVENGKNKGTFMYENQAIRIVDSETGATLWLGEGTFQKMFFEHIYPSYTAYNCRYLLGSSE